MGVLESCERIGMRPDDLKRGDWITITSSEEKGPLGVAVGRLVTGQPVKVVAVSLPFICVTDGRARWPIDVRQCCFSRTNRSYINAMRDFVPAEAMRGAEFYDGDEEEFYAKEAKPEKTQGNCPKCGGLLVETLTIGSPEWLLVCRECNTTWKVL